jgi:hypothetical protein
MALVPVQQTQLPDGSYALVGLGSPIIRGKPRSSGGESSPARIKQVKIPPGMKAKLVKRLHDGQSPYRKTWGPPTTYVQIPRGELGTVATLKVMKELVLGRWGHRNPEVVVLAKKIVEDVSPGPSKDYRAMCQAILTFMKTHCRYQLDPSGLEYVQTPHYTLLVGGSGDCDDLSTATLALAGALGFRMAFRTVKADPGRPQQWSHVYPVIGIQDKKGEPLWLTADATQKESFLGWDPPEAQTYGMKTWVIDPRTSEGDEWDS